MERPQPEITQHPARIQVLDDIDWRGEPPPVGASGPVVLRIPLHPPINHRLSLSRCLDHHFRSHVTKDSIGPRACRAMY